MLYICTYDDAHWNIISGFLDVNTVVLHLSEYCIDASVDISFWFSLTPVMWYVDISIFGYLKWQLLYIINVWCLYIYFLFFFFGWMDGIVINVHVCSYLKEMLQKCLLINTTTINIQGSSFTFFLFRVTLTQINLGFYYK